MQLAGNSLTKKKQTLQKQSNPNPRPRSLNQRAGKGILSLHLDPSRYRVNIRLKNKRKGRDRRPPRRKGRSKLTPRCNLEANTVGNSACGQFLQPLLGDSHCVCARVFCDVRLRCGGSGSCTAAPGPTPRSVPLSGTHLPSPRKQGLRWGQQVTDSGLMLPGFELGNPLLHPIAFLYLFTDLMSSQCF